MKPTEPEIFKEKLTQILKGNIVDGDEDNYAWEYAEKEIMDLLFQTFPEKPKYFDNWEILQQIGYTSAIDDMRECLGLPQDVENRKKA